MSDGASSCLITGSRQQAEDCFEILDTQIDVYHKLAKLDPVLDSKEYAVAMMDRVKTIMNKICTGAEIEAKEVDVLISQNLGISTLKMICYRFGLECGINFTDNLPAFGHVGLADNLINLLDYLALGRLSRNALVLLLATGPYSFGLTALRRAGR
jgi:3-oxoacyl-[acyl-carrier-protein] synthase III